MISYYSNRMDSVIPTAKTEEDSHFLAQTLGPLSFCAKLLFGYIQIFLVVGILFLQSVQLNE